ncbi:OmpA family protein [Flavobacterium sp. RHBU_3]|uniref:OmpA family protein n=1 Tax=Flavobacterium sp. RHBU_3 TaxID=3391184 RepID=UPI003985149D
MKKAVLPLLLLCLSQGINAQEADTSAKPAKDYNKWTVEFGGGINKVSNPLNSGYHVDGYSLYHLGLGARYMFNTKFGAKLDVAMDRLKGDDVSIGFQTKYYSTSLQGIVNVGRLLEFEEWTKRLNVMGHMGVGVGVLTGDEIDKGDKTGNFLMGMTGQLKLSNRVSIYGDFTMLNAFSMQLAWDGHPNTNNKPGFDGTLYNASVGINIALGSHKEHADWYVFNNDDVINELENRVSELEELMNDVDKDGVPDYLDVEPNTPSGALVDPKGRNIDLNKNGVPDYIDSALAEMESKGAGSGAGAAEIVDLINDGYVNIYFDFNKDMPTSASTGAITFLITYLKDNPEKSASIWGFADEIGDAKYNQELSERRANNVKKIFTDAGIDTSRLTIEGKGVDNSVNKDSSAARQTVRRVKLVIK